ncbi:MAG: hypothetical protein ABR507_06690 [Actinomycetota bacterium]|nr:hypothetical protein [Actinomycetota bacterium]
MADGVDAAGDGGLGLAFKEGAEDPGVFDVVLEDLLFPDGAGVEDGLGEKAVVELEGWDAPAL